MGRRQSTESNPVGLHLLPRRLGAADPPDGILCVPQELRRRNHREPSPTQYDQPLHLFLGLLASLLPDSDRRRVFLDVTTADPSARLRCGGRPDQGGYGDGCGEQERFHRCLNPPQAGAIFSDRSKTHWSIVGPPVGRPTSISHEPCKDLRILSIAMPVGLRMGGRRRGSIHQKSAWFKSGGFWVTLNPRYGL